MDKTWALSLTCFPYEQGSQVTLSPSYSTARETGGRDGEGQARCDTGSWCQAQELVLSMAAMGFQNKSAQDVPLWYVDCSELKAAFSLRLNRNSCPSFNYLEEFALGALPIMRLSEITSLDLATGQERLLLTKHLLLSSCNTPLKSPRHLPGL